MTHEPTNEDVLQNDLRDLLDALGMPSGAQPRSPHEVFRDALMRMKLIRNDALEEAAQVADEEYRLQISLTEPTAAFTAEAIAAAIRALNATTPPPSDASA